MFLPQMLQPTDQGVLNIRKSYYIRNVYTGAAWSARSGAFDNLKYEAESVNRPQTEVKQL
jgi:hypothetical protein